MSIVTDTNRLFFMKLSKNSRACAANMYTANVAQYDCICMFSYIIHWCVSPLFVKLV